MFNADSIVTTLRGADIKVEVANFCAAMDTLIDQDGCMPASVVEFDHDLGTCSPSFLTRFSIIRLPYFITLD